jgi:uncharacterized membrane protein
LSNKKSTSTSTRGFILTFALHFLLLSKNSYFCLRIITFFVIIITFFVITKAQAKAKANAIVKIRTTGKRAKGQERKAELTELILIYLFYILISTQVAGTLFYY